jgi:hypothetical protein
MIHFVTLRITCFVILAITMFSGNSHATLIPPFYLNSVVALGSMLPKQPLAPGEAPHLVWFTEGTGFFYGHLIHNDPDKQKRQYQIFLVTARHVITDHNKAQLLNDKLENIKVRLNPRNPSSPVQEFTVPTKTPEGEESWFYHPNNDMDVAIVAVDIQDLRNKGFYPDFFPDDVSMANRARMSSVGITAGDGIFVLGFPINLAGEQKNYVIARQGAIGRVSEMLDGASPTFLLDAFVFPGNSGGPVILRPEMTSIQGTPSNLSAYLIGMVLSYHAYSDTAVSAQTGHPRITFEENSGLSDALPVDYIDEAISSWIVRHKK